MTRLKRIAFETAMAEIEKFGYDVWTQEIELPKPGDLPDRAFFAFYEDPDTGEGYCRTYIFDKTDRGDKAVSFVKIKNYHEWKEKNPILTESYLANGVYLYRGLRLIRTTKKTEEGVTKMMFFRELDRIPV